MDAKGWGVTVSAGIVELSDEIETVDALIGAADAQMYAAKRAGKDRILASTLSSGAWEHTGQDVLREGAAGRAAPWGSTMTRCCGPCCRRASSAQASRC